MAKLLIFSFDGTSNEPSDAVQTTTTLGSLRDDNITNILKFHLLAGGNLTTQGTSWPQSNQQCFYYHGVGTYGSHLRRLINAAISPEKSDVATILRTALRDFNNHYQPDDQVLVTGFSRGGALARRFAALLPPANTAYIFEAIFDTVASVGLPNLSKADRPKTEVLFENGCTLPAMVERALHMVSLDDKRKAFQPTLMNKEHRVTEVWFGGAHADVGGGYYYDGLSDLSLRFMLNSVVDWPIGITLKTVNDLQYEQLLPAGVKALITKDDLFMQPDPFGTNHQQDRWPVIDWFTLTDRRCCVIEHDKISTLLPTVHWSVGQRIHADSNYRPASLKGVNHQLLYADGEKTNCQGLSDHIEFARRNVKVLAPGESTTVTVFASEKYNHTGLMLEQGKFYDFAVLDASQQKWLDGGVETDADGWDRADVNLGLRELSIAAVEPFRRVGRANWFQLIGTIGTNDDNSFIIGKNLRNFTSTKSGEFCPFANDLMNFYGNNSGKLQLKVTRIE